MKTLHLDFILSPEAQEYELPSAIRREVTNADPDDDEIDKFRCFQDANLETWELTNDALDIIAKQPQHVRRY